MSRVLRRVLPSSLFGLAGVACVLCCLLPVLVAAGVLGGAGWLAFGEILPGVAAALAAGAGVSWWAFRRRRHVCAGGDCGCS
jgi:mercuric ion transport protein